MKKILFVVLAAFAFACDAPNQSSERGAGTELEDRAPADPVDETENTTQSDTTAADDGMEGRNQDESKHSDF